MSANNLKRRVRIHLEGKGYLVCTPKTPIVPFSMRSYTLVAIRSPNLQDLELGCQVKIYFCLLDGQQLSKALKDAMLRFAKKYFATAYLASRDTTTPHYLLKIVPLEASSQ